MANRFSSAPLDSARQKTPQGVPLAEFWTSYIPSCWGGASLDLEKILKKRRSWPEKGVYTPKNSCKGTLGGVFLRAESNGMLENLSPIDGAERTPENTVFEGSEAHTGTVYGRKMFKTI